MLKLEVVASGGRVQDGELQLLVRSNDEHRTCGQWNAGSIKLIGVQHAECNSKLSGRMSNDGVREVSRGLRQRLMIIRKQNEQRTMIVCLIVVIVMITCIII